MNFARLSGRGAVFHLGIGRQAQSQGCWWPLGEEGSRTERQRGSILATQLELLIRLHLKATPPLDFLAT